MAAGLPQHPATTARQAVAKAIAAIVVAVIAETVADGDADQGFYFNKFFPYKARGRVDREPLFSYSFIPSTLTLRLFLPRSL